MLNFLRNHSVLIVSRDNKQPEVNLPESFEFQDVLTSASVKNFVNERSLTIAHSEQVTSAMAA